MLESLEMGGYERLSTITLLNRSLQNVPRRPWRLLKNTDNACFTDFMKWEKAINAAAMKRNYYPELEDEDVRASIQYAIALVASEDIHLAREPV